MTHTSPLRRSALVAFALSALLVSTAAGAQPVTPSPEMVRDVAETVFTRAVGLERVGRILEAEPLFAHAIDTDPGFLPAYLGYARALAHRGHRDAAIHTLVAAPRRAVSADREAIELARALHGLGDTDAALERLRASSQSLDVLRVEIELASASGRFPEALAAARRVADQQSDNRQARVMVRALTQLVADADAVHTPNESSVLRRLLRE